MENEKKNTPSGERKNHHSGHNRPKHRNNKHKSYFMTPEGEQPSVPEQKPTQNAQHAQSQQSQQNSSTPNSANKPQKHNNNHHRHKKNNNPPAKDEQKTVAETAALGNESQARANDSQKSRTENTTQSPSQNNAHKNNNRNKNKRKRTSEKHREDRQNTPDNASANDKLQDSLAGTDYLVMPKSDRLQKPAPQKLTKFSESPEYEKFSDYEEFSFEELYGNDDGAHQSSAAPIKSNAESSSILDEPTVEVVGIRFKASGKTYYFAPNGVTLKIGAKAIVETARGLEYGDVALGNTMVKESETVSPLRPVIRKATDADIKHHEENKVKEDEAFRICNEKIIAHGLEMKLIDAQYTFDNTKLLFYFTSAGRVDFRDLVKDLASVFRTRIELRQIGIRDEAKMVGGLGLCGRPLCCSLFLTDFGQVSIKMAKEQNLSLNSSKISGICGRLMCCLRYEHETYEYEIKRTPPVDSLVRTVDGVGVVTEINPLAATVKVKLVASPDTPPKSYKRDEVTVLKKKQDIQ